MNLRRLKNVSVNELRVRVAQKASAFSERRGWSPLLKFPNDNGHATLDHFRTRSAFFASFQSPETTVAAFKARFPETAQRLVEKADRIVEGRFDLLGYKDLSFGNPIDWHFEPISEKRLPLIHWSKLDYLDSALAGDKKIIWELNRHQYFTTLGQAYWLTGDELYARTFTAHLESWMEANPPKLGINWASSLEVAFRSMAWLWAFSFFKSSPSFANETFTRAWKFLHLSARHLESYLSTYFSPNTHLTGEALGLFYLGTLLPEFDEAKHWQQLGSTILIDQLPIHVQSDGVYFEQSSYYHRYTTDFYLHFLLLARANNFTLPPQVEESLKLLLDHLMYITRPDGTTPLFGDDDGGRLAMLDVRAANDFRGTLATGAVVLNRGDYKFVAGDAAEELLWLTGADGLQRYDSIAAHEPEKTSVPFFVGGYFVMRDGWKRDSNYLLFDCGPHGALNCGHAHADALSIDVAANGRTVLVDPGTYTYTGDKELRDWFRSSHAHNTVTLENESSSVSKGPFSWKTTAATRILNWLTMDRFDYVAGAHAGFTRFMMPAFLMRSILFLRGDYWIICDEMGSAGSHEGDIWFHFDSNAKPMLNRGIRDAESGFAIACLGRGQWTVEEDQWVSHCYGQKEPGKAFAFSVDFGKNDQVFTFLFPSRAETEWKVGEVDVVGGRGFVVDGGKTRDLVIIWPGDDSKTLWARVADGEMKESIILPPESISEDEARALCEKYLATE